MSYGPHKIILVLPPRVLIFALLCSHVRGIASPIPFPRSIDARLALSVLSVGNTRDTLVRVGFEDAHPTCSAIWPAGDADDRGSACRLPNGTVDELGRNERRFLEGQTRYLETIRNISTESESNLGISYNCVVSESGLDECRVIYVKGEEPFSTGLLRREDPGVGLFLSDLNREVSVRWFDVRRQMLDLDSRTEVRHRFRTTFGEKSNRTVCEVWLETPFDAEVSVVGPELREAVVGSVVSDPRSAYGRVTVETANGEDVSLLICEVATVTGLRSRFHHPTLTPKRENEP